MSDRYEVRTNIRQVSTGRKSISSGAFRFGVFDTLKRRVVALTTMKIAANAITSQLNKRGYVEAE